jgi:hypothetical protein
MSDICEKGPPRSDDQGHVPMEVPFATRLAIELEVHHEES